MGTCLFIILRQELDPVNRMSLCLASTATQNPCEPALASSTDTSGHPDKVPVLIQNLPDEQRFPSGRCFTLAVGGGMPPLIRNPIGSLGGQSASRLSLCLMGRLPGMPDQTTGCLSASIV